MKKHIKKIFSKYLSAESGATAVEFALVSVLFFSFLIGIAETGRFFWLQHQIQYSVETATRHATVTSDYTTIELEDVVTENLEIVNISPADVTINVTETTVNSINFVEISVDYTFESLTALLPEEWDEIVINATSRIPLIE